MECVANTGTEKLQISACLIPPGASLIGICEDRLCDHMKNHYISGQSLQYNAKEGGRGIDDN